MILSLKLNENKIDIALNKMDEWLPEDPEAMERYYEILDQEGWKEMEQFFIENGNEDVLQSMGLKSKDMKKLAQAAMESFSEIVSAYSKINEKVTTKDILETIKEISKKHKSSFVNPFLLHQEPTHIHKKLGAVKIHPGVRAYDWRNDGQIAVSTSLQGSKDWSFTGADLKDLDELPKNFKLPEEWLPESVEISERKIQTKRKYTDKYPAKTVGKTAKIRNKILEALKDGKISEEEFDKLVKELSSDHKRWMKRNGKMFNVSEDGISLSKFGKRILKGIVVNESFASFTSE